MIQALLFAALLPLQAKTVEERIKELSDRIEVLDKKATDLAAENQDLRVKLHQRDTTRQSVARGTADYWMKRHGIGLSLTEEQASRVHALWQGWILEDFEKPVDQARWKVREATLRSALTPEQAALLEKSIRAEQEAQAKAVVVSYSNHAGIEPANGETFVTAVMGRIAFDGTGLIPHAHSADHSWSARVHAAVEASVSDLAPRLNEEELLRLRKRIRERNPSRKEK
jgi:hypothetical protein